MSPYWTLNSLFKFFRPTKLSDSQRGRILSRSYSPVFFGVMVNVLRLHVWNELSTSATSTLILVPMSESKDLPCQNVSYGHRRVSSRPSRHITRSLVEYCSRRVFGLSVSRAKFQRKYLGDNSRCIEHIYTYTQACFSSICHWTRTIIQAVPYLMSRDVV